MEPSLVLTDARVEPVVLPVPAQMPDHDALGPCPDSPTYLPAEDSDPAAPESGQCVPDLEATVAAIDAVTVPAPVLPATPNESITMTVPPPATPVACDVHPVASIVPSQEVVAAAAASITPSQEMAGAAVPPPSSQNAETVGTATSSRNTGVDDTREHRRGRERDSSCSSNEYRRRRHRGRSEYSPHRRDTASRTHRTESRDDPRRRDRERDRERHRRDDSRSRSKRRSRRSERSSRRREGSNMDRRDPEDREASIARHRQRIEDLNSRKIRVARSDAKSDDSGEATPPLHLGSQHRGGAARSSGSSAQCTELALVHAPPPPPPPPQPPPWAEVEHLVMEALRKRNKHMPSGWPAIVAAAYEDELDCVDMLLQAACNPNETTASKASALWHAVSNTNFAMVQLLLEARADANHKKKNAKGASRSILDMAIHDCAPEFLTQALMDAGAVRGGSVPQSQLLALNDKTDDADVRNPPLAGPANNRNAEDTNISKEDMFLALAGLQSDGESDGADEETRVDDPYFVCDSAPELATKVSGHSEASREATEHGQQVALLAEARPELQLRTRSPSAEAPAMTRGSTYAARSAFRKSYSKQLLPLIDDKPALDFSMYNKDTAARKTYAGIDIKVTKLRGTDAEYEKARARVSATASLSAYLAVNGKGGGAYADPIAPMGNVESKYADYKPDIMKDPWGCVMAVQEAEDTAGLDAILLPDAAFSKKGAPPPPPPPPPSGGAKRMPVQRRAAAVTSYPTTSSEFEAVHCEGSQGSTPPKANSARMGGPYDKCTYGQTSSSSNSRGQTNSAAYGFVNGGDAAAGGVAPPLPLQGNFLRPPPPKAPMQACHDEFAIAGSPLKSASQAPSVASTQDQAAYADKLFDATLANAHVVPKAFVKASCQPQPARWKLFDQKVVSPSESSGSSLATSSRPPFFSPRPPFVAAPASAFSKAAGASQPPVLPSAIPPRLETHAPALPSAMPPSGIFADALAMGLLTTAGTSPSIGAAPPAFPAEQPLPRLAEAAETAERGSDRVQLNEAQTSLVKSLAGGAGRHDPARQRFAARDQAKNTSLIDVRTLRFCHETISPRFMHGTHRGLPVLTLLDDLHRGKAEPSKLPPMVVMRNHKGGLDVVCGNRRLYCLKRFATEANKPVSAWCIVYDVKDEENTPRPLIMKYILAATTQDSGSINIRRH